MRSSALAALSARGLFVGVALLLTAQWSSLRFEADRPDALLFGWYTPVVSLHRLEAPQQVLTDDVPAYWRPEYNNDPASIYLRNMDDISNRIYQPPSEENFFTRIPSDRPRIDSNLPGGLSLERDVKSINWNVLGLPPPSDRPDDIRQSGDARGDEFRRRAFNATAPRWLSNSNPEDFESNSESVGRMPDILTSSGPPTIKLAEVEDPYASAQDQYAWPKKSDPYSWKFRKSIKTGPGVRIVEKRVNVSIDLGDWTFTDVNVTLGEKNPGVFLPAGRQKPQRIPVVNRTAEPPAVSECPSLLCKQKKLEQLGVNTGERHGQWDDELARDDGRLEDSYNWGSSPFREKHSVSGMYEDIFNGDSP